jgi:asparagine synthase (glutamine-hydrolysing)
MTMISSLESRAPFLDHRLVELMMGLPAELKIGAGTTKRLLRELGRELLPPEVLARPKRGFALPVQAWLSRDLAAMCQDVVGGRRMRETGWFRPRELERLLAAGRTGALSQQLWLLLCLGLWLGDGRPA